MVGFSLWPWGQTCVIPTFLALPRILRKSLISPRQHQIHHSAAPNITTKYGFEVCHLGWHFGTLVYPKRQELEFGIGPKGFSKNGRQNLRFLLHMWGIKTVNFNFPRKPPVGEGFFLQNAYSPCTLSARCHALHLR